MESRCQPQRCCQRYRSAPSMLQSRVRREKPEHWFRERRDSRRSGPRRRPSVRAWFGGRPPTLETQCSGDRVARMINPMSVFARSRRFRSPSLPRARPSPRVQHPPGRKRRVLMPVRLYDPLVGGVDPVARRQLLVGQDVVRDIEAGSGYVRVWQESSRGYLPGEYATKRRVSREN